MSMATLLLPSDAAPFDAARTVVAASAALGPDGPPSTTKAATASTESTAPTAATGSQLRRCGPAVSGGRTFSAPAGGHAGTSGGIGAGGTGVSASYTSRLSCPGQRVWIRQSAQASVDDGRFGGGVRWRRLRGYVDRGLRAREPVLDRQVPPDPQQDQGDGHHDDRVVDVLHREAVVPRNSEAGRGQ